MLNDGKDVGRPCVITKGDGLEVDVASGAMTRLAGVSEALTGSTDIHLAIATVPPGRCSTAHYHVNCESAIYVVSGGGLFLHGEELEVEGGDLAGGLHLCASGFESSAGEYVGG